ncbi:MAG: threonine/serine exporter family protein [Clostridia bacterium]|nr:threonine/serine exporter family protein [Clostridia bacterium]
MTHTEELISAESAAEISRIPETGADDILRIAMDIGEGLLTSGAEIHRVELALETVCRAYGGEHVEVFCINSLLLASLRMPSGSYSSQTRRVKSISTDLYRLERYNSLSRRICADRPHPSEVDRMIREIKHKKTYPFPLIVLGYMLASGGFSVFFGGSWRDGIAGALVGFIVALLDRVRFDQVTQLVKTLLLAFCGGMLAHLSVMAGIGQNVDMIIIGSIMLLIPGLALGNAMRDLFGGDILSGSLKIVQSCMIAVMIVIGYALSILLLGGAL